MGAQFFAGAGNQVEKVFLRAGLGVGVQGFPAPRVKKAQVEPNLAGGIRRQRGVGTCHHQVCTEVPVNLLKVPAT